LAHRIGLALAAVLTAAIAAVASLSHHAAPSSPPKPTSSTAAIEQALVALSIDQIESGDLLLVRGDSMYSDAVRSIDGDSRWTHVGMLAADAGVLVFVDASPSVLEDQVDTGGRVQRRPLDDYLREISGCEAAVYRVQTDPAARRAAAVACLRWAARRVPFDGHFDAASADALYCSEMIWRAYRSLGLDLAEGRWQQSKILWMHQSVIFPDALAQGPRVTYLGHLQKGR
jgi:hypothetical protein